MNSDQLTAAVK